MPETNSPLRILGFAGSLRRRSYNRRLLDLAATTAPGGIQLLVHDIHDVPLFDEDVEADAHGGPEGVRLLRAAIAAADGVLIATPEYNQSMPGVLKNVLDWLSRKDPAYGEVLAGKPVAIVGATPGRWGTRVAQAQVRHALSAMEALVMATPQVYIAGAGGQGPDADPFDAATARRLGTFLEAFREWVGRVSLAGDGRFAAPES